MNKRKKQNQQTHKTNKQPAESPICFQSQAGLAPEENSFAQILPSFPVPHKPAFQEKVKPNWWTGSDAFLKVQSNLSRHLRLIRACPCLPHCDPPVQNLSHPLPVCALILDHLSWILPLQIKQPCGGLGNYFSMQTATIAEWVFVDLWLICVCCEICACVK